MSTEGAGMNAIEKHLYNKGRNDGLEEAALEVEFVSVNLANRIRALKSTPAPGGAKL